MGAAKLAVRPRWPPVGTPVPVIHGGVGHEGGGRQLPWLKRRNARPKTGEMRNATAHCEHVGCGNLLPADRHPRTRFCSPQCRLKAHRSRKRAEAIAARPQLPAVKPPCDRIAALCEWAESTLIVPPGHPLSGQPMSIPEFGRAFLRDCLEPSNWETLLCMGRKNGKSAIVAVLILGCLVGPLRSDGFRAGVASVSKAKSRELLDQIKAISEASGLSEHLKVRLSPSMEISSETGRVELLAAEGGGGHASSFDFAIIDELGLLQERDRPLVESMLASTAAKRGCFVSLSIHGPGPFIPELIARRDEPGVSVHLFQADPKSELADEKAWKAANPGLGSIKSLEYLRHQSRRAVVSSTSESLFRAQDLNLPVSPDRVMICSPDDWTACTADPLPARSGWCYLGIDLGGSRSMTAAAAYWPDTGRLESWSALPGIPDIATRNRTDKTRYDLMVRAGELVIHEGQRVTDVETFLRSLAADLAGESIRGVGTDRFRQAEFKQAIDNAGLPWPPLVVWRGTGASKTADGSHDVRAFQRAVMRRQIQHTGGLLMLGSIQSSSIRFDVAGNPALDRSGPGRIDALQAAVIAVGLAAVAESQPRPSWRLVR